MSISDLWKPEKSIEENQWQEESYGIGKTVMISF